MPGDFLYLDWYNAYRISLSAEDPTVLQRVRGRTRAGGCRHTRIVSVSEDDRWLVEDEILLLRMPWEKKPRDLPLALAAAGLEMEYRDCRTRGSSPVGVTARSGDARCPTLLQPPTR